MIQRISILVSALLMLSLFSACGEQGLRSGDEVSQVEIDSTKSTLIGVSGKLFSIPSPIQTAMLIKEANVAYNQAALHDAGAVDEYQSKLAQALNLGVYGTGMAYASLYDDGQAALRYFKAVDKLSNNLDIKGAIDANLVKRLGANVGNADSLLLLSGQFYRDADGYLKENDRLDIAAYVLLGGWVEATYLTALAANEGIEASRTRIAEQKVTVKTLLDVLDSTGDQEYKSGKIHSSLKSMATIYEEVTKTYTYVEPEVQADRKMTLIKSTSNYSISDDQLIRITELLTEMRNQIIG